MSVWFGDLRRSGRMLRRQPGFALAAALILGFGIGANTVAFSVADAVLLKPLPYPASDRLVAVWPDQPIDKMIADELGTLADVFDGTSAHATTSFTVTAGAGPPERVTGAWVGARHFEVLRTPPSIGRGFLAGENEPGRDRVVILGYGLWQRRFGADRDVVGQVITVDDVPRTVVGVMPEGFQPLAAGRRMWVPIRVDPADEKDYLGSFYFRAIGRLGRDVGEAAASDRLADLVASLRERHPNLITDETASAARAVSLHRWVSQPSRGTLALVLGAVACVLLITCTNVANLVLTRSLRRQTEMATRTALGAGRGALVRMLLVEGLVLAAVGAVAGLVLAWWSLPALVRALPSDFPRRAEIGLNGSVLTFGALLAAVTAVLFGLWPAWRASRLGDGALRSDRGASAGRGRQLAGRVMAVAQIAGATILLVVAGLLLRSLSVLGQVDPGFRPEGVLSLQLTPAASDYPDGAAQVAYHREVLARLETMPEVERVGAIHLLPLTEDNWRFPYTAEGHPITPTGEGVVTLPDANFRIVTPGYFETMAIPLVSGRTFTDADDAQAPAAVVVNRALADRWWSSAGAPGKTLQLFGDGGPVLTVIGVVEDVRQHRLDRPSEPELYQVHSQWPNRTMSLLVRTRVEPAAAIAGVRAAIHEIDPRVPVSGEQPLVDVIRATLSDDRLVGRIALVFSVLTFGLGMFGLYAVITYLVAGRRREFGLRMALGAQRKGLLALVLAQGLVTTAVGLGLGLLGAVGAAGMLRRHLFGIEPFDGLTFTSVAVLVAAAATLSTVIPAWRASRTDPVAALRSD